jgi:hypothetical protein
MEGPVVGVVAAPNRSRAGGSAAVAGVVRRRRVRRERRIVDIVMGASGRCPLVESKMSLYP